MNKIAPDGQIYICTACGKRSKDHYGDVAIDSGWDVSCMLNSVLVYELAEPDGLYRAIQDIDTEKAV